MNQILEKKLIEKLNSLNIDKESIADILQLVDDYFPDTEFKKNTIDIIIKYAEKIYQNKYGMDLIFVQQPIPAKIRINLNNFKNKNSLDQKTYKKYIDWLLIKQKKELNIFSLYDSALFNLYQKEGNTDEFKARQDIEKKLNRKLILKL